MTACVSRLVPSSAGGRGGGGARGCRGDLSRPIHARGNLWQKGFVESLTQSSALNELVTIKL